MTEREWTNENIIKLIEMYRNRPHLWDCQNINYKDRNKRHDGLVELAVSFGESKEEIERKIKNLLSHFSRELKKEGQSVKSGVGADNVYKSKWFAFKSMLFLKDKNKPKNTINTEDKVSNSSEEGHVSEDDSQTPIAQEQSSEKVAYKDKPSKQFLSPKKIPTRKRKADDEVQEAYNIMKEMYANRSLKDEYDLFGEQIAIKVRQLPTAHARIMVQHIVNTTLFEAQMGKYNNPPVFHNADSVPYNQHIPPQSYNYYTYTHSSHTQPMTPSVPIPSASPSESHTYNSQPITPTTPFSSPSPVSYASSSQPSTPTNIETL